MNPLQFLLISAVRLYRWTLSPAKTFFFGPFGQCRFTPTCSAYAIEAVRTHGALAGSWLALKRIGRCHPWGNCGHDPVPPNRSHALPRSRHRARAGARAGGPKIVSAHPH